MFVWVELVCFACARTTAGRSVTGAIPRREMKAEAKREGWKFEKQETFCSSFCKGQWAWNIENKVWQKKYAEDLAKLDEKAQE